MPSLSPIWFPSDGENPKFGTLVAALRFYFRQSVACTTPAFRILNQRTFLNQILNVADCRSMRTLRQFLPLLGGQLSLESIKETIQHEPLSFVYVDV